MPLVEAKDLHFSYQKQTPILDGLSFRIEKGDYFGIIGPNGSGKSTLLKLLLGLLKPDSGSVRLFDMDPFKLSRLRADVGYVSQIATRFDPLFPATVLEVVRMGRVARLGVGRFFGDGDIKKARFALKEVGMEKFENRKIGELSTGQQQRVVIARALAGEPKLLVLDEPTAGVDARAEAEFYEVLARLNKQRGMTLVIISHDLDIIGHHVNKLMCIHCTVTSHGTQKQFLEGESLKEAVEGGIELMPHHDTHDHHEHA